MLYASENYKINFITRTGFNMSGFNREKFESGFNPQKFELEKKQSSEMRALIDKHKSADTLGSASFYDQRIEMKKRQYKNFIELAINSFEASMPYKGKIDDDDRKAFESVLNEIATGYLEREKSSLKSAMISYGNTIDSEIVGASVKAYEKQLTAVKISTLELVQVKIESHNNGKLSSAGNVKDENAFKKYFALIVIGLVMAAIIITILYLVL
jgi:hypothetical protein